MFHTTALALYSAAASQALKVGDTVLWEDFANRKLEDAKIFFPETVHSLNILQ